MARKNRFRLSLFCGLAMMLAAGPVLALGLGNIQVKSHLDELFSAVIPLSAGSPSDLNGLSVSLGSAAAFRHAGIEATDALSTLHFTVQTQGSQSVVVVNSDKPIREPFLNFLVQVQWNGGTLLREYTVLMNPPDLSARPSPTPAASEVNSAPSAVAQPRPESVARPEPRPVPKLRPATSAMGQSAASATTAIQTREAASGNHIADGSRYGPVKPLEIFWSIATRARPDAAVSLYQVLWSIYDANRSAFNHGRFDGLMEGSTLDIPSAARMRAVSETDAKARIQALRSGQEQSAVTGPATPSPATAAPSTTPGAAKGTSVNSPEAAPTVAPPVSTNAASTATASYYSSKSVLAQGKASQLAARTTPPGAELAIAGPAVASSVVEAGTAPVTAASATTPAKPTTAKKPVGKTTPTPTKTTVTRPPPSAHQADFLQRWRLPLLGLLAVLLLPALLLRNRRHRAEADEGFVPPVRPPVGPTATPAESTADIISFSNEDQSSGLGAGGAAALAGVVGAAAVEAASSSGAGYRRTAIRYDDESFDRTVDGDAQTLEVGTNSSDDPLAEADFHLAYGFYDEAIQLLENALMRTPQRMDLQLKLAECYAEADKPVEYQELAEKLRPQVSPEQWRRLAEQGRKLCPGVALFGASEQFTSTPARDVAATAGSESAGHNGISAPQQTPGDNIIDFEPSQIEPAPKSTPPPTVTKTPVPGDSHGWVAVPDLNDFDNFGTRPTVVNDNRVDFNLDAIDLSEPDEVGIKPAWNAPMVEDRPAAEEPFATQEHSAAGDDEFATKLDLARAYSDMGDNDAARSLLEEVVQGGDAGQKHEAEALARKLGD